MKTHYKPSYEKPFLQFQEQIDKLKNRGMIFDDEEKAKKHLENINYYRLSGYWLIFEKDHKEHLFNENTSFEKVLDIYIFDRKLRLLFLEAIERIEVSIRTRFAHILSERYGSHFHLLPELFQCPIKYAQTVMKLKSEVNRSHEIYIAHFKNKYKEKLPPIWSSVELMTLGQISNWFDNIKHRQDKQKIAKYYGLDEKVLSSFLHHLTIVRNISAHHSRLWNRRMSLDFILPKYPQELKNNLNPSKRRYLYNTIIVMSYILSFTDESNGWFTRVQSLMNDYGIEKGRMGFPY